MDELNEALESARSKGRSFAAGMDIDGGKGGYHSLELVRGIFTAVLRELPEDWTVHEILEQLKC